MNDKFLVALEIKKFILSLEDTLINYPKKDIIMKKKIFDESLHLLKLAYLGNNSDLERRKQYQNESLVSISMLDYYFEYSYKKNYISLKVFNNKINNLTKINKMIYGWIKSNEL